MATGQKLQSLCGRKARPFPPLKTEQASPNIELGAAKYRSALRCDSNFVKIIVFQYKLRGNFAGDNAHIVCLPEYYQWSQRDVRCRSTERGRVQAGGSGVSDLASSSRRGREREPTPEGLRKADGWFHTPDAPTWV